MISSIRKYIDRHELRSFVCCFCILWFLFCWTGKNIKDSYDTRVQQAIIHAMHGEPPASDDNDYMEAYNEWANLAKATK